jgi:small multidrug resistance family-3 protein
VYHSQQQFEIIMESSQNNWLEATTTTSNNAQHQQQQHHHHPVSALAEANVHDDPQNNTVDWTTKSVVLAVAVFVAAGLAEIGGGWLVWQAVRGGTFQASSHNKISRLAASCKNPWGMAILGSLLLVAYGFIPTLQPPNSSFGRVYAVYGGFFIVLSFLAGWALDGDRPDRGDLIGGAVALAGVLLVLFWPR